MYRPSARAEVIAALLSSGGKVTDQSGFASSQLAEAIESVTGVARPARNLASLLIEMEKDDEIVRHKAGRRTYTIEVSSELSARLLGDSISILSETGADAADIANALQSYNLVNDAVSFAEMFSGSPVDTAEVADSRRQVEQLAAELATVVEERDTALAERDEFAELLEDAREENRSLYERVAALEGDFNSLYQQVERTRQSFTADVVDVTDKKQRSRRAS